MFDVGWSEMLVIAVVLIVVVGPKDLPRMLRTFGKTTAKMRAMAGDFRKQFDEALKEAELDDVKTLASDVRKLNPAADIRKALSPLQSAAADLRAGVDAAMKPTAKPDESADPAPATAVASEPLKNGPDAMPGAADTQPAGAPKAARAGKAAPKPAKASSAKAPQAKTATAAKAPEAKPAAAVKPAAAKASPAKATAAKTGPATTRAGSRSKAGGKA